MNKKKICSALIAILLLVFSFYYTNKSIELIRNVDPIMKQIKYSSSEYIIEPENALIIDNKIIPGKSGRQVDYEASYQKMKQFGSYNEALTVFMELKPTISIEDYYDKYIISGNTDNKRVALVFKIIGNENIVKIIDTLKQKEATATFFIDGVFLENNITEVKKLLAYELELLSYDNKYNEIYFSSALSYLSSLTAKPPKYCYADYDQKEVIELCSKFKLHTIVPTIKVESSPYKEIKNKLTNSAIIYLPITSSTENELQTVIDYIKQKGYSLVTLEELLQEQIDK